MRDALPSKLFIGSYLLVAFTIGLVVAGYAFNRSFLGDFWEHAAVVHEFARHPWHPRHPLFDLPAPDSLYSPYALVWGIASRVLGIESVSTLALAGIVNLAALFSALLLFLRRVTLHPWTTGSFTLPLMLFLWGRSAWLWSGFFHLEAIVLVSGYPSTFAAALLFLGLAAASKGIEKPHYFAIAGACTAFTWITHPPTAIILTTSLFVIVVAQTRGAVQVVVWDLALATFSVVGGFAVATFWPYFSLIELLRSPIEIEFNQLSRVFFEDLFERTWPIIAVSPLVLWRLRADRRDTLAWLAVSSLAVFLVGLRKPAFGRAISWVGVFSQIAVADTLAAHVVRRPLAVQRAVAAGVVWALAGVGALHFDTVARAWPRADRHIAGDLLRGIVGADDVVLADLKTGRMLPSTTGKIVASPHPAWWVPDHEERRQDVRRFFDAAVGNDVRRKIVERWHARFIFVDMTSKGSRHLVDELGDLATEERRDQRFRLFRVR